MSAQWMLRPLVHLDENVTVLFVIHTSILALGDQKYAFVVSPDDTVEEVLRSLFKICSQKAQEWPLHYSDVALLVLPNKRELRPLEFRLPILAFIGQDDQIVVKMRFSWKRELADGFAYFMVFFLLIALVLFVVLQAMRLAS